MHSRRGRARRRPHQVLEVGEEEVDAQRPDAGRKQRHLSNYNIFLVHSRPSTTTGGARNQPIRVRACPRSAMTDPSRNCGLVEATEACAEVLSSFYNLLCSAVHNEGFPNCVGGETLYYVRYRGTRVTGERTRPPLAVLLQCSVSSVARRYPPTQAIRLLYPY